jgi:3-phenylpropionate/trans-cinnamate dioxygenase ferredoxin subunit
VPLKRAGTVDDLAEGARVVDLDGVRVLLMQIDGEVRATSAWCTHARTLLSPSSVDEEGFIECPMHAAIFSSADGSLLDGPSCEPLPVYPATVDDQGAITVEVPETEPEPGAGRRPSSFGAWTVDRPVTSNPDRQGN